MIERPLFTTDQPVTIDELQQLHLRIRRRTVVISALLGTRCPDAMGEAMKELLDEVISIIGALDRVRQQVRLQRCLIPENRESREALMTAIDARGAGIKDRVPK